MNVVIFEAIGLKISQERPALQVRRVKRVALAEIETYSLATLIQLHVKSLSSRPPSAPAATCLR
jgi:hypothetical protein